MAPYFASQTEQAYRVNRVQLKIYVNYVNDSEPSSLFLLIQRLPCSLSLSNVTNSHTLGHLHSPSRQSPPLKLTKTKASSATMRSTAHPVYSAPSLAPSCNGPATSDATKASRPLEQELTATAPLDLPLFESTR